MMIPNDLLNRLSRMDRTLQAEDQTDQIKLARKGLEQAMFWLDDEKQRRIQQKLREQEARLKKQEEEANHDAL